MTLASSSNFEIVANESTETAQSADSRQSSRVLKAEGSSLLVWRKRART